MVERHYIIKSGDFELFFGSPKGRGHTKPTTGEFKVFLDFIVFIFWYTITMGIEYD